MTVRWPVCAGSVVLVAAALVCAAVGRHGSPPRPAPLPRAEFTVVVAPPQPAVRPAVAPPLGPSRVYVPSLGIDAPYVGEQVVDGLLRIPADVHTVGLDVTAGAVDGTAGTVLLAGHVNYAGQGAGALHALAAIVPRADVWLTDRDGVVSRWTVTSVADPLKPDLDQSIFAAGGPRRLVLVTCGGAIHHGDYDRNVVVYAVPVSPATSAGTK